MIQFILAIKSIFENDVPLLSKSRRKNFAGGAKARLKDYQTARKKTARGASWSVLMWQHMPVSPSHIVYSNWWNSGAKSDRSCQRGAR